MKKLLFALTLLFSLCLFSHCTPETQIEDEQLNNEFIGVEDIDIG